MVVLPAPLISHSLAGFPVGLFSHTIGFDPHACARGWGPVLRPAPIAASSKMTRTKNRFARGCALIGILFMVSALFPGNVAPGSRRRTRHGPGQVGGRRFSCVRVEVSKKSATRVTRQSAVQPRPAPERGVLRRLFSTNSNKVVRVSRVADARLH